MNDWHLYDQRSRRIFEKYFQIRTRELLTLFSQKQYKASCKSPIMLILITFVSIFFFNFFFPLQRNCSREKQVIWSTKLEVILDMVYMSLFNAVPLLCRGAFSMVRSSTWKMRFINGKNLHRPWISKLCGLIFQMPRKWQNLK